MEQVNWQRRRDILLSIVCIGIIIWFVWNLFLNLFVHAVLLLLLSMALAFLITPGVNLLEKYKIPRLLGALAMYIIVLVVIFLLFSALAFSLIQQVLSFRVVVTEFFITLPDQFKYMDNFLVQKGIPQANIDDAINQVKGQLLGFAQSAATNVVNVAFIVTNAFIDILLILVLSFYFTLDGRNIRKNLVGIIPARSLKTFEVFQDALNRVVGNYIRGQLTLAAGHYSCRAYIVNSARPLSAHHLDYRLLRYSSTGGEQYPWASNCRTSGWPTPHCHYIMLDRRRPVVRRLWRVAGYTYCSGCLGGYCQSL